jgi:zinc D-Ala-D-Ala carboxypeptidase
MTGRRTAITALAVVLGLGGVGAVVHSRDQSASASRASTTMSDSPNGAGSSAATKASEVTAPHKRISLDLGAHSTTDPSSIWVVVNKTHPIDPLDFTPRLAITRGYRVAEPAAGPLADLLAAGEAAGMGFKIESAYPSYGYQESIHAGLVAGTGQAAADRVSARAGFSEHQTGLAIDLITPAHPDCDMDACFATTPAGRWLAQNAWRFGFIVRYTPRNEAITGYSPEPWHIRYIGRPLAAAMRTAGIATLEQVFRVRGGNYR